MIITIDINIIIMRIRIRIIVGRDAACRPNQDCQRVARPVKSLLRLDADGICGTSTDLVLSLAATREAIEAFSCLLEQQSSETELPNPTITSSPPDLFDHRPLPPCSPSIASSSRSSWRCDSAASTSATSISPRDSIRRRCSPVSPSPSPCLDYEEYDSLVQEEAYDADADESFMRLSSILASLQAQAEAAVGSPSAGEEEVRDFWATHDSENSDISPISTRTIRSALSIPNTPGLMTPGIMTPRNGSMSLPRLALPLTPSRHSFSLSGGLIRRRTEKKDKEGEVIEGNETDLERLVGEFLDERLGRGEEELMFRWVWMYLMGGGIVWWLVAWALQWGCSCANGGDLCVR
ncbi:hypothetical protein EDC01DRAFT_775089 [Geopyxis carbonaria]|nr:hypothetical protein EDC01DRAFT_775089 [Geopyxis carbonaria]